MDTGGDRSLLAIATTQNDNDSIDDGIDYTEEQMLNSNIEPNQKQGSLNHNTHGLIDNQVYQEFKEKNLNSHQLLQFF